MAEFKELKTDFKIPPMLQHDIDGLRSAVENDELCVDCWQDEIEKAKAKYDDIAEQIESKKAKRELFKGFISNFGEAGLLNPRVRCRDLEQPCAGSDCEIQGRYKIHIQERI